MLRIVIAAVLVAGLTTAAIAQTTLAPTSTTSAPAAKAKKPASGGLAAARERQKKCGAEWKEPKAADKVEKGMTWPKFWSACNKRLKTAG